MKRKLLFILVPMLLVGCQKDSSEDDGNPNQKSGVTNLETSRLGKSGGFFDVDADGKKDLIITAPEAKTTGKNGVALVYLNYAENKSIDVDAILSGESNGDAFGFNFADIGDVNGDDKKDFAISALNATGDVAISGAVYVYQGGEFPPKLMAKINGENSFDKFGFSMTGSDVNGDGESDFIVTAPHTFHEEFQAGAVYVYFGGKNFDNKPDVIIKGDKVKAGIGMAITAGDVNGDAVADIIMDGHSKVFIYYGGSDLASRIKNDPTPDVKIRSDSGAHGGSGFGYSLAYVGDLDNDGYGEVAVGNRRRSSPSLYDNAGSLYIFKGGENIPAEYFEDDENYRLVKIVGSGVDEAFANSIRVVGDVNEGGSVDIVVGARWADNGFDEKKLITGNVYLFHGEDLLTVEDASVDQTVSLAHAVYSQEKSSAELGTFVAVDGKALVSGMPGSNKHDGGLLMTDLSEGGNVTVNSSPKVITVTQTPTEHQH